MEIVASDDTEEVLPPAESATLTLENTSPATHYFITVDPGTAGEFPPPYAHRFVGETRRGERQFSGTGRARAIAYSMTNADFVQLEIQNITHTPAETIIAEPEEAEYHIRLYAVYFD